MKGLSKNLLLYYSTAASVFITVSGFVSSGLSANVLFQLFFLPVTMYLVAECIKSIRTKSIDNTPTIKDKISLSSIFFTLLFFAFLAAGLVNISKNKTIDNPIDAPTETTPLIFTDSAKRQIVLVEDTDIYAEANESATILDTLPIGTILSLIAEEGTFFEVLLPGDTVGFVLQTKAQIQ